MIIIPVLSLYHPSYTILFTTHLCSPLPQPSGETTEILLEEGPKRLKEMNKAGGVPDAWDDDWEKTVDVGATTRLTVYELFDRILTSLFPLDIHTFICRGPTAGHLVAR